MPRTSIQPLSILAVLLLAFGITLAAASPAMAHESLASSSPAEGERLETAPSEIELVFKAEILDVGATIMVVDETGRDWAATDPQIDGASVTVALDPDMPDAGYQVRWRVVSGDGHPIESVIPFTVGGGEPFTALDSAPAPAERSPGDEAPAEKETGGGAYGWLLSGGVGVAAIIAVVLIYLNARAARRRKTEQEPADEIRDLLDD